MSLWEYNSVTEQLLCNSQSEYVLIEQVKLQLNNVEHWQTWTDLIGSDQLESLGGFFGLPRLWAPCRSGRDGALLRESLDSNSAEPAHMAAWHTNRWLRFHSAWKKYAVCGTRIVKKCKGCICSRILKILPWLILIVFDFARKRGNRGAGLAWFEGFAVLHASRYFHEPEQIPSGVVWVTVRFLAAQSIVDVFMEVIQFYGYAAIGQPREYLQLENFLDLLWAVIPSYLWFNPQCLGEFCNTSLRFLYNMFEVCRTSINWHPFSFPFRRMACFCINHCMYISAVSVSQN